MMRIAGPGRTAEQAAEDFVGSFPCELSMHFMAFAGCLDAAGHKGCPS